jgi:PAS domain S-box-containing protein
MPQSTPVGELRSGPSPIGSDEPPREGASESGVRSGEERFHDLVDAIADYSIFLLDAEGNVATWNPGAHKIKGYEESEIIGRHFSLFYPPEDRARHRPEQILETVRREGRYEEEGFRLRKDGTRFWASVVISGLRDAQGHTLGFAKVTRDLTERRAAEEQLRRSEERFRLLVESVTDYAIYMLSPSGEVQTWNIGAQRMKGFTASEVIGKNFAMFFPAADRDSKPRAELATAAATGRFEDEGYRIRKDGTPFWVNVVLTAIRDERGELLGFAKVTRDLSARRQAEETARQLAQAQAARNLAEAVARKADESNRVKDEFLAMVSHELRTPLNAIVGWSAILRQRELEPALARGMEVIERNALAQVKIIEDILDISRVITGKLRLEPQPADLVTIVNQALEVVRHSATAKHIRLEFPQSMSSCPIIGDAERLQQVVWNLASNAVKFTSAGGAVRVELEQRPDAVSLHVTDSGIGIDAELLPYLFERFKQGDSSSTRRFGGLGLGLALVRHIAELHGGSVSAASPGPGLGSTFSISLPMGAHSGAGEKRPGLGTSTGQESATALSGVRVLLVEDDVDSRELVGAILNGAGATVRAVGTAAEAFAALPEYRPHILLSDIAMPDEDGYGLIRRVRELGAAGGGDIPSIALTAYTRPEDRTKAMAAGFTTHLSKPVNPPDLIAAIARIGAALRR